MNLNRYLLLISFSLCGASVSNAGAPTEDNRLNASSPTLVTAEILQARTSEAEADPDLHGDTRTKLVALYREALANLKEADANSARAAALEETLRAAPDQTERLRKRIAAVREGEPGGDLAIAIEVPRDQLAFRLKTAKADIAAIEARRADLDRQMAYQEQRPATITQRLAAAQDQQVAIAAALQAAPPAGEGLSLLEARRWGRETRYIALSAEIKALEQELLSLPMRVDLLKAKRDEETANAQRIGRQLERLIAQLKAQRTGEMDQAQVAAERNLQATRELAPALVRLAADNASLTEALATRVAASDQLEGEQRETERLTARIKANFDRLQRTRVASGLTEGVGQLLLEHRDALPDLGVYSRRASAREREIAAITLDQLRHLEEVEVLADAEQATARLLGGYPLPDSLAGRGLLGELVAQRQDLLRQQLEAEGQHLERLRKLQTTEAQMLEVARAYDAFLAEHLFWLRTGPETHLADLAALPEEVRQLLSPAHRSELSRAFLDQVAQSGIFWSALLLAVVLWWKRRALISAIERAAASVADPSSDHFFHTVRALLLTLALALPLPLVLGVTGWRLLAAAHGTELSLTLGADLVRIALILYMLLALRAACLPNGLAVPHFHWSESRVRRLGAELRWLVWVTVPALLMMRIAMAVNPSTVGGPVARVALLVATVALGGFFYRVLHHRHGLVAPQDQGVGGFGPHRLWLPLAAISVLVLVGLAWTGYTYTALILADAFVLTLGLIVGLLVLYALAERWLTLARRRLALQMARERQQSAAVAPDAGAWDATEGEGGGPSDYADFDLVAASEESLELLRAVVAFSGALGLYLIWSAVFPALGILDEFTLWHYTTTLDGDERSLPVTLADVGLAFIYLVVTGVLVKRLPALLDMILTGHSNISAGTRYTLTTLTSYAIIAIGTLLALNQVGAQWSQVQWLVAALSVGIGFGLQEIVANFISGLIILFERPIRVGDTVSVGGTDGVVTKIRIRATTIRNPERKELLVPNKEFITGRLLNWSLSDKVTRIMVTVGVAFGTDVDRAHALMREAAELQEHVLEDPKPVLTFDGFGDNALLLSLRAYIDDLDHRTATLTALHKAINRKFEEAGIVMPFPQRDLHLDTGKPLRVSIESPGREQPDATRPG